MRPFKNLYKACILPVAIGAVYRESLGWHNQVSYERRSFSISSHAATSSLAQRLYAHIFLRDGLGNGFTSLFMFRKIVRDEH